MARYWWTTHHIEIGRFSCEGAESMNAFVKKFLKNHNNWHFEERLDKDEEKPMLANNVLNNMVHRLYDLQLPSPGQPAHKPPAPPTCGKCKVVGHRFSKRRCPCHKQYCPRFCESMSAYARRDDCTPAEQDHGSFETVNDEARKHGAAKWATLLLLPPSLETVLTEMVAAAIELDDRLGCRHVDEGVSADATGAAIRRHPATTYDPTTHHSPQTTSNRHSVGSKQAAPTH